MADVHANAEGCLRDWYRRWYAAFVVAHGRLPPPHWEGPPIPARDNATHDALAAANRKRRREAGETWMY